ncbi:RNA polymerase sigma factor [Alteribacter natronophilus]|uniref:RNA polymerase sigma factor n=1 Tax=Alteribacter natronophilus TaxID=2583810 RepID=UPI00110F4580|nr:RNA polymerase sigma factor [Alteribacter natronophilus]TMW70964.1 RNA polymerase sigma factor [Alteribacter natronophilus]
MTDYELIEDILAGDQQAVRLLHERYVDRVFHYIYNQTSSHHDTEELLQDVFFKAACQLERFEGKSSFKTWLFKIARNAVIDFYRKQNKARRTVSTESAALETLGGRDESAEHTALRKLHMENVVDSIDQLPDQYRTVLHLRFIEDFSLKETAEIMGKSVLAIKAMQRRARTALSESISMEVTSYEEK